MCTCAACACCESRGKRRKSNQVQQYAKMGNVYWTLIAAVCICIFAQAQLDYRQENIERNRRLCGKHLANEISQVCKGKFNNMYAKKSDYEPDYAYQSDQEDQALMELSRISPHFPFRSRMSATAMYPKRFRRYPRGGITEECCDKPCSIEELRMYCAEK